MTTKAFEVTDKQVDPERIALRLRDGRIRMKSEPIPL